MYFCKSGLMQSSSGGGSLHLDHHDRGDQGDDHGAHDGQDGEVVGRVGDFHQIHSLSSQQINVWKEHPWHRLQLEHISPLAHRPYLPKRPPHISPGPFWQTVRPQELRVVPYVQLPGSTSGWLGSQLGGKAEERTLGTMAVMMRSRKRCASTAVLIVVGGNMLETDWGVEEGWEGERA